MTSSSVKGSCSSGCSQPGCGGCAPTNAGSGSRYEHLNCLVATAESDWWECDCGQPLEEPTTPGVVICACGQQWRFGYWPLAQGADGQETTGLEPRRV